MKKSLIYSTALKLISPLLWAFAFWIYWRGHNLPGGGFIGGLVAGLNGCLLLIANHQRTTWAGLRPSTWVGLGLTVALMSSLIAPVLGLDFMKGVWVQWPLLPLLGTPMLFDLGVFLLVFGMVLQVFQLLWTQKENS
ncbi:MAG: Na(+)/H(+) antiporter subunit B [Proteobacteria bacterium]|jgi:multisubunit Na+/H+ antiporter MnhB subunit|nr:Na(+)/H(+) antiporter subunit B [Pseudomonadota bacterium]